MAATGAPTVYDVLAERLRELAGDAARAEAADFDRFRVVGTTPLVLVSIDDGDDLALEEGDPDFEIADAVKRARPAIDDIVAVIERDGDYFALGVLLEDGADPAADGGSGADPELRADFEAHLTDPGAHVEVHDALEADIAAEAAARAAADATKQDAATAATDAELSAHAGSSGLGAHIPPSGIPTVLLAFDPATQAELDAVAAAKENTGAAVLKSLLTAKGDLIAASAAGTPVRVAAGPDAQVLTADHTAPGGVTWAPQPAALGGHFRAYATTGAPTINGFNAWAKVTGLTNESWDDDNIWDGPNSRLVIPAGIVAGSRWAINAALLVSAVPAGYTYAAVFKNNAEVERIHELKIAVAQDVLFKGFAVVPVVAGDVIDVRLQWDGGSANLALNQGSPYDFVEGWRIK